MKDVLKLHALADNQLDPLEAAQIQDAIQNDPALQIEYHAVINVKDCLKTKVSSVTSDETWRVCVRRLDEIDRTKRVEGFVGRYAWAMCSVFFICISVTGWQNHGRVTGSSIETADLVHVMTGFGKPVPAAVSPMDGQLDFIMKRARAALAHKDMNMLDRQPAQMNGLQVSRYVIQDRWGKMMLMVIPAVVVFEDLSPMEENPGIGCGKLGALTCVGWHENGYTLALLGDRPPGDLATVAGKLFQP